VALLLFMALLIAVSNVVVSSGFACNNRLVTALVTYSSTSSSESFREGSQEECDVNFRRKLQILASDSVWLTRHASPPGKASTVALFSCVPTRICNQEEVASSYYYR